MSDSPTLADRAALVIPESPRWVPWLAGALGLIVSVLRVALEGQTAFVARTVVAVVGVATPLLFVAAGLGVVLEGWRRREWRRRTQFLAVEAVERMRVALSELAGAVVDVVRQAAPESAADRPDVRDAFVLPFGMVRQRILHEATAMILPLQSVVLAHELGRSPHETDDHDGVVQDCGTGRDADVVLPADAGVLREQLSLAAVRAGPALAELAGRVRAGATDLSRLVGREGQALLPEALELELRAVSLATSSDRAPVDDADGRRLAGVQYLMTVLSVVLGCAGCMRLLENVDATVRKHGDDRLPAFLAAMEAAGSTVETITEHAITTRLDAMATSRRLARANQDGERLLVTSRRRMDDRRRRLAELGVAAPSQDGASSG